MMTTDRIQQEDRQLLDLLQDLPAPEAPPEFFDRALARAVYAGARRQRRRWLLTGFGAAVAATVAVWFVAGTFFASPGLTPDDPIPGITMTLEQPRTVNFVFSSATALDSAMLTVSLPPGIELEGFPGQREITWETSLREGRNLLPLTLVALTPAGGDLLARLEHEDRNRTFRLRLTITDEPAEGTSG